MCVSGRFLWLCTERLQFIAVTFVLCRCCFVFLEVFHTDGGNVSSGKLQGQLVLVAIAGEAAL